MKIPAQAKGFRDEVCTLQFGDVDAEESEQIVGVGGTTYSCQIVTKPGVPITLSSTISLGENVEEFIDYVVDGVLRASSALRKSNNKKYSYKIRTDKVLAYRFEGGKKKGLKICGMEAKLRSAGDEKDIKSTAGAPETAVSTIEVQHWRKYPEGFESQPSSDQSRAPSYDKFNRWTDREQTFPNHTPHEYTIHFVGDGKNSKTLKDRVAEEKPGFNLFRAFKFLIVSPEKFQKLGGTAPRYLPQVVIPVKDNTKEKGKETAGENDKKGAKLVKGKQKELGESSKVGKAETPGPEKRSSEVAKPRETGEKAGADEETTKETGERVQPIDINFQSTVHIPDTSERSTNNADSVAVVSLPAKEDGTESEEEPERDDEHINNNPTFLEQSQDPLEDYYKTVDEVLEESNGGVPFDAELDFELAIEENNNSGLHGDSDVDLDLQVPSPAIAEKKASVLYGLKGGPADQLCRVEDLAAEDEIRSSAEAILRGRSSTPAPFQPVTGDGNFRKGMEASLMTPPPSTEKKTVGSIPMLGSPTPFNFQSPRGALSPLRHIHHVMFEGPGNFTALKTAPRRASFSFDDSITGMEDLFPLDLSTSMDPIESRIASSQRGNALLRGRQAGRGRSASPAPRSFSPNFRSRGWHAKNSDTVEDIPNRSLFTHFKTLADAIVPPNEVHVVDPVQVYQEEVEQSPQANSEQERKAREVQEAQEHQEVAPENIPPRTPTRLVALPTPDTPHPQRTSTPRAATPPTPTPQPPALRSELQATIRRPSKKPRAIEETTVVQSSSRKSQPPPVDQPVPSKKSHAPALAATASKKHQSPTPISQPTSSKKPQAAAQSSKKQAASPHVEPVTSKKSGVISKKSEASSSKKSQPASSKKRKADAASINKDIDNRPAKRASTPTSKDTSVLARRLEEAKARIEAAKKASEKLKEEEDMIMEVQKLEQEARQLEQDNALRKSNIERVGGGFK